MFASPNQALSAEKLNYIGEQLTRGNRLRYCAFLFAILIAPITLVKGFTGGLDMLITAVLLAFMLRSVDPVFARFTRTAPGNNPAGAVPALLPVAIIVTLGAIFDFLSITFSIMHGFFSIGQFVVILMLAARVVVAKTVIPLARMVVDSRYQPAGLVASGVSNDDLLMRRPVDGIERFQLSATNVQEEETTPFRPFSGQGVTLSAQPTETV